VAKTVNSFFRSALIRLISQSRVQKNRDKNGKQLFQIRPDPSDQSNPRSKKPWQIG
jgi:hypothetical protein